MSIRTSAILRHVALALLLLSSAQVSAQQAVINGADSDPNFLEWMTGFPPAEEKLISQPYSDFWSFPKIRWTVCHLRELLPTRGVSRGTGAPLALGEAVSQALSELLVPSTMGGDTAKAQLDHSAADWLPLKTFLINNYTDGFIVLHKGVVVYEYYGGCLDRERQHATMSMTKSVTGLLAEMMIAAGQLDDSLPVTHWVPELGDTSFAGATLRQVLNMTTGVAFDETYSNPESDLWVYASASDAMPKPASYEGPVGFLEFLLTLQNRDAPHGTRFKYGTINTDVLGWVISRATGQSLADVVSTKLWQPMGAELDAYFKNDARGIVHAGGGLNAGLRDLARLGQLLLDGGRVGSAQVIPAPAVTAIMNGATTAEPTGERYAQYWPGYRSMWWYGGDAARPLIAARGVYGQTLYLDPAAEVVMVRLSSHPVASNVAIDPGVQPVYRAIADILFEAESVAPEL